ncbi:DUF397 domain-containing protein [Kitasatospora sp. NPDC048239]|uniref:DUF397 domain-containing protein n=1 Tax=Kitasatospora sp. NPDC048239 TaxID=3364046 RepID=UPI0037184972
MIQIKWQKSSFSSSSDNCVEVRATHDLVELRESDDGDIILRTTPAKFAAFLQDAKAGKFDHHADRSA